MTDTLEPFVDYWTVHSKKDERPVCRGWARSEAEAAALLGEIKKSDGGSEDAYWVLQMTASELEAKQAAGEIPSE